MSEQFTNNIRVGPEFFAKAKNDYANFHWAIVREFMQNSMDCGSDRIEVGVGYHENGKDTCLTVTNNGESMTRDILENKLLSLGSSGKEFHGTVGGFGKAKEILYFCHKSYSIRTGDLMVQGEGGSYSLAECGEVVGTTSQILLEGDHVGDLTNEFRRFVIFAQWDGEVILNGKTYECSLRKGSPRKEFEWGTIYTNKSFENKVVVRVGGIPMFSEYTGLDRCVIIELKGTSQDVLTANRDSLVGKYRNQYQQFLTDLVTNKSRALKSNVIEYTRYGGAKYRHTPQRDKAAVSARDLVSGGSLAAFVSSPDTSAGLAVSPGEPGSETDTPGDGVVLDTSRIGVPPTGGAFGTGVMTQGGPFRKVSAIQEEFILKNETTMAIPAYYQPDNAQFGTYGKKLARMWGRLLLELHKKYNLEKEFAIGFVFTDDAEAQYEQTNDFGVVYYINPVTVVEQANSTSKSFKKRFALTERNRLLAIAVHEFLHGRGYSCHDETYAGLLTDMMWEVMDDRKRFNWCFN